MSETTPPQKPEKTVYERDKTAKERQPQKEKRGDVVKPKPKIKKAFVPKKKTFSTDKPMEHRVRSIRMTSMESAKMIWETLVDYQNELAQLETDDPDQHYHDWEKVEKLFIRLAKKYSACTSKALGGSIGWVYKDIEIAPEITDEELINTVMSVERFKLPEPIKTKLGFHIVMVCESQVHVPREKPPEVDRPPLF